jgi:hypothetical protein
MHSCHLLSRHGVPLVVLCLALGWASDASAGEEPVVQDVLEILKERGIVDDTQYVELSAKNSAYQEEHDTLLGRIEWSGDLRVRLENFWFDTDTLGQNEDNRTRMRYRLRVQGKAEINEYVDAVFGFASGEAFNFDEGDNRSTNRTLGRGNDFSLDPLFIDRAYLEFKAPKDWAEGLTMKATAGKVYNPFRWKIGRDYMIWDGDINPEGVAGMLTYDLNENLQFFLNTGYFILDENSTGADPHVFGIQGGLHADVAEDWSVGGRATYYAWRSLNNGFFSRSSRFGTIEDGLTEGAPTVRAENTGVLEVAGYVRFEGIENWPILLYGHWAKNLDAVSSVAYPAADTEDTGWGLGVEVGDKKKYVALGLGYYRLEANYSPAQFIDSDLFDGYTNRKGWTVYGAREILPNTELAVTLFWSDELRTSTPAFETSVSNADRIRLQTDIQVKF